MRKRPEKDCPQCGKKIHVRVSVCDCGFCFYTTKEYKNKKEKDLSELDSCAENSKYAAKIQDIEDINKEFDIAAEEDLEDGEYNNMEDDEQKIARIGNICEDETEDDTDDVDNIDNADIDKFLQNKIYISRYTFEDDDDDDSGGEPALV